MTVAPVGRMVRAPKTAELIAAQLRGRIVRGELKAGDTLRPESELMTQFVVSRPTLREAFRLLATESLLDVRRGSRGGAMVMAPDIAVAARYVGVLLQTQGTTIVDVYEARMVLEPACVRLVATRREDADLADLRAVVEELRTVVEAEAKTHPNPVQWSTLTYRFHELLLQRSGNKTLAVQGGVLQDIVNTHLAVIVMRHFDEPIRTDRFRRTIRSYEKLIALIEAKDVDGAEAHWREHMEVAAKSLLRDDLRTKPVVDLFN